MHYGSICIKPYIHIGLRAQTYSFRGQSCKKTWVTIAATSSEDRYRHYRRRLRTVNFLLLQRLSVVSKKHHASLLSPLKWSYGVCDCDNYNEHIIFRYRNCILHDHNYHYHICIHCIGYMLHRLDRLVVIIIIVFILVIIFIFVIQLVVLIFLIFATIILTPNAIIVIILGLFLYSCCIYYAIHIDLNRLSRFCQHNHHHHRSNTYLFRYLSTKPRATQTALGVLSSVPMYMGELWIYPQKSIHTWAHCLCTCMQETGW